jgi:hypothetical protein
MARAFYFRLAVDSLLIPCDSYVDGYMDGQAARKRTDDNPDVTFGIR